jgi:cell shape-determining protein MreC
MIQTLKKGDRVVTTGYGRTNNWGKVVGKVTHRRGDKVFVQWENTSFPIEDEMDIKEIRLTSKDKDE